MQYDWLYIFLTQWDFAIVVLGVGIAGIIVFRIWSLSRRRAREAKALSNFRDLACQLRARVILPGDPGIKLSALYKMEEFLNSRASSGSTARYILECEQSARQFYSDLLRNRPAWDLIAPPALASTESMAYDPPPESSSSECLSAPESPVNWSPLKAELEALLRRCGGKIHNLIGADLRDFILACADLSDVNLFGADLSRADLRRANFERADLSSATLAKAKLGGANLRDAKLNGAKLCCADLRGADLNNAKLIRADLAGSDLRDVEIPSGDLSEAILVGAKLEGANIGPFLGAALKGALVSPAEVDARPDINWQVRGAVLVIPGNPEGETEEKFQTIAWSPEGYE